MKNFLKKLLCITILFSIVINATACFWTNKKSKSETSNPDDFSIEEKLKDMSEVPIKFSYVEKDKNTKFYQDTDEGETIELFNVDPSFELKVKTENTNFDLYVGNKSISSTYEKKGNYYIILPENKEWEAGKTYRLELYEDQTFYDENYTDYANIKFSIKREKTNKVDINKNVEIYNNNDSNLKGNSKSISSLKDLPKSEKQEDKIILIQKPDSYEYEAFKITKVNKDGSVETVTPDLEEIYKDIDVYEEFSLSFDDPKYRDYLMTYKKQITEEFRQSYIMDIASEYLYQTVYAADKSLTKDLIKSFVPIVFEPYSKDGYSGIRFGLDFEKLGWKPSTNDTADMESGLQANIGLLTGHNVYFVIDVAFKIDVLSDIKGLKDFTFVADENVKITFSFKISAKGNAPFETWEAKINDVLRVLASNPALTGNSYVGSATLCQLPFLTPIPGVTINILLIAKPSVTWIATLETELSIEQHAKVGLSNENGKFTPIGQFNVNAKFTKFKIIGQVTAKVGIGLTLKISFISDLLSSISLDGTVGPIAKLKGYANLANLEDEKPTQLSFEYGYYKSVAVSANVLSWKYSHTLFNSETILKKYVREFSVGEDGKLKTTDEVYSDKDKLNDPKKQDEIKDPIKGTEWDPNLYPPANPTPIQEKFSKIFDLNKKLLEFLGGGNYNFKSNELSNISAIIEGEMYSFDENGIAHKLDSSDRLLPIIENGRWIETDKGRKYATQ